MTRGTQGPEVGDRQPPAPDAVSATAPETRVGKPDAHDAAPRGPTPLARANVADRLQRVAAFLLTVNVVTWFLSNVVRGTLRDEFRELGQWGPPLVATVASLAVYLVARSRKLAPAVIVRIGLLYEVIISYAIVFGSSFEGYLGAEAADLTVDRVGLTWVIPWTLLFTVLVQAPMRSTVIALAASSIAPLIGYEIEVLGGRAPVLTPGALFVLFVLPYAIGCWMTYVAAKIVHELNRDVRRAQELGSYRLVSRLGQGGMGEVWRATHHTLARPAAIKIIRPDALDSDPAMAQVASVRFEREAQAIASLQSRHTVQLYDFGVTQGGTLYYVMELLDGMDLEAVVHRDGPLPPARVVHVLRQACASLAEAHRRGVIHRDVKPANIYLCREAFECDVVKLLDFGLAKRIVPEPSATTGTETRSDVIMGTPAYLAPEVITGEQAVDGRADLYALGCVAYWLLTGRLLFESTSAMGMLAAHLERAPQAPSQLAPQQLSKALDAVVLQCLAKHPNDRPADASALAVMLADVPEAQAWSQQEADEWWSRVAPRGIPSS